MSFWGELKRRNVYKVGIAYAIVAWLIIEAVATIFPVLQLPEWSVASIQRICQRDRSSRLLEPVRLARSMPTSG